MKAPRPGDAFHLDLDGTVIAGRYVEADPPVRMLTEWDRQGTDKATPTLALIEITFTPTGDGTTPTPVCGPPGQLRATRRPRSGAETRQGETYDVAEIGLSLVIDGGIRLVVEDGLDKIVLVQEAVVKPRSAHVRRGLGVFEGGASHAALMD
jgi:Activator of Hsp90 ATPase homolog 1-like protein